MAEDVMENMAGNDQGRENFLALVDEVCAELGYPPNEETPEAEDALAMEMELDGIPFSVVHDLGSAPERILIECRFGPPPPERTEQVLYRLLHFNRGFAEAGDTAFGIEAETGDLIYTHACDLAGTSGRVLLGTMTEMGWQARQWRTSYFLDQEGPGAGEAASNLSMHLGSLA